MSDSPQKSGSTSSVDGLIRGVLTKVGDTIDRFTGRRWVPSSSLAASQLIERIRRLLDSEVKEIPGKGKVVPHKLGLRMQWNKFADDNDKAIASLKAELLAAAIDHINDSHYYTLKPVTLDIEPDYFIDGVKLTAGFGDMIANTSESAELNVTVPSIKIDPGSISTEEEKKEHPEISAVCFVKFIDKREKDRRIAFDRDGRISVGRIVQNGLQIDDVSVSKAHATIVLTADNSLSIADTGSTNGTFINGTRISYGKAMEIADNDTITFGSIKVRLRPEIYDTLTDQPSTSDPETVEINGLEFRSRENMEGET